MIVENEMLIKVEPEDIIEGTCEIPKEVIKIGQHAFFKIDSLVEIYIPDRIQSIEVAAFAGCRNLKRIHLPDNLSQIGVCLFLGCENLEELTLSEKLYAKNYQIPYSYSMKAKIFREFSSCEKLKRIIIEGRTIKTKTVRGTLFEVLEEIKFKEYDIYKCVDHTGGLPLTFWIVTEGYFMEFECRLKDAWSNITKRKYKK